MKNTAISRAVAIIGKEPLRQLLKTIYGSMSLQMINRSIRNGYAPSDWYEIIEIATNGKVSTKQLMDDCYLHKRNCKPKVVRKQVQKFLQEAGENPARVRKSAQGAAQ